MAAKPETWAAFVLGVLATWAAAHIPNLTKSILLWAPRRLGKGFADAWKHAPWINRAKTEPLAATVYVAKQLSLLVINLVLALVCILFFAVYEVIDPRWSPLHWWAAFFVAVFLFVCLFRIFKRYLLIAVVYAMVFDPPKPGSTIKIGSVEIGNPQKPPPPPPDAEPMKDVTPKDNNA